jgi:hypothetical protein
MAQRGRTFSGQCALASKRMAKRKKTTRADDGRGRERIPESARRLRELYERGIAELEERRKREASSP